MKPGGVGRVSWSPMELATRLGLIVSYLLILITALKFSVYRFQITAVELAI